MQRITRKLRFTQPELTKRSGLIQLSNIYQRGQSVSASAVSDDSKVPNVGKREPKDERREMVESYAIEYNAMNEGKFPSASETKKQVGGCYHVTKSILHEMELTSTAPSIDTMHEDAMTKEMVVLRAENNDGNSSYTRTVKLESEAEPENLVDHQHTEKIDHERERSPSEGQHPHRKQQNPSPELVNLDLTKGIDLIHGSNVSESKNLVAASVVSDDSKVRKRGKIVPRDERRVMVESYVIKYKELNGGKFPTASETTKQVGGSYYVIKNIIQEIKHISESPPTDPKHQEREEIAVVNKASANVTPDSTNTLSDKVINSKTTLDGDNVDLGSSNLKSVGSEQELNTSTLSTKPLTEHVMKPRSTDSSSSYIGTNESKVETVETVHLLAEKTEHNVREKSPSELDKHAMDISDGKSDNEKLPKQTSMWGNLKSYAHGIIKKWRGL